MNENNFRDDKNIKKENDEKYLKDTIIKISKIISHNDNETINEINYLMNNTDDYIKDKPRKIENKDDAKRIGNLLYWLIMVDTLKKHKYVCELDWKEELEIFIDSLSKLKTFNININKDIFNKDDTIKEWCKIIDDKYETKIGCIDIDSDSYVLLLTDKNEISKLRKLAEEIDERIDYGKNC